MSKLSKKVRGTIYVAMVALGLISMLVGMVIQQIEAYKITGVFIAEVFVIHWSLWFYLGIIPVIIGVAVWEFPTSSKNKNAKKEKGV